MTWSAFETKASGKWVLAGEHAVLRGGTAVALPHPEFKISLVFEPNTSSDQLRVEPEGATPVIDDLLFVVRDAGLPLPRGILRIVSSVPIGAGLGSSAALCVAMCRWMAGPLKVTENEIIKMATQLEHRFHGKSSGMDISVIKVGQPIAFSMEKGSRSLDLHKIPCFTFHDTGLRAQTRDCIKKVEEFGQKHPVEGRQKDQSMNLASRLAIEGLTQYDAGFSAQGLLLIREAMLQAQDCFYSWGLVPSEARKMEAELLQKGALAVKMTGAGGGGMLVALWSDSISTH